MISKTKMNWAGGFKFDSVSKFGLPISTDESKNPDGGGGEGYSPIELILYGLIGCIGIDVVMIMKKMRQELKSLEIEAIGHRRDEPPRLFQKIELIFRMDGKNLDQEKAQRAVQLSQDKYCSVSQSLIEKVNLTYQIEIAD